MSNSANIGLRNAKGLCNMVHERRLEFIAEGLPIIFRSTTSLLNAAKALSAHPREAAILTAHGEEECAKILILIDIVRCPKVLVGQRVGPMMSWFYDHMARLLYAEAQTWKPTSMSELQSYVDFARRSHYLEGDGTFIAPNWTIFGREIALYADVLRSEEDQHSWVSPNDWADAVAPFDYREPTSYQVAKALFSLGAFGLQGLRIVNGVWGRHDFSPTLPLPDCRQICSEMLNQFEVKGVLTDAGSEDHARTLDNSWQAPMYGIDFKTIHVPISELEEERGAILANYV